jgi:Phage tail assembly chaperone proteins, E, or 41 or 14
MITDRTKTIELSSPVMNAGVPVTTLTFRPPTVGDRRKAEGHLRNGTQGEAGTKFQVAMMALCTGMTDPAIEQLDMDVFLDGWSWILDFLAPAQQDFTD